MTKASESLIKENELQTEKIEGNVVNKTRKPLPTTWTVEEEKTLAELLKIHKWLEWDAIAADLKTRTAGAIEAKVRKAASSTNAFGYSNVKKEIISAAKMVENLLNMLIDFLIVF